MIPKGVKRRKTTITGYVIVAIGALQAAGPALQTILTSRQMAAFTVLGGVAVAVIGHYNNQEIL